MIYIGTSGWNYKDWKGPFYPTRLAPRDYLAFYAERFSTVEINNSFYRLPEIKTLESWHNTVSPDFVFAVKASRYITHMKKLKQPKAALHSFFHRMEALGEKLGPALFQLPPRWGFNRDRLQAFLEELPRGVRCAFEFRDESWHNRETHDLLRRNNAAFCIYHLASSWSPCEITADFIYMRLHGPGAPYKGKYSDSILSSVADNLAEWDEKGSDIYCYFDNDEAGYAIQNAATLMEMIYRRKDT